jgi:hypothetical protein
MIRRCRRENATGLIVLPAYQEIFPIITINPVAFSRRQRLIMMTHESEYVPATGGGSRVKLQTWFGLGGYLSFANGSLPRTVDNFAKYVKSPSVSGNFSYHHYQPSGILTATTSNHDLDVFCKVFGAGPDCNRGRFESEVADLIWAWRLSLKRLCKIRQVSQRIRKFFLSSLSTQWHSHGDNV